MWALGSLVAIGRAMLGPGPIKEIYLSTAIGTRAQPGGTLGTPNAHYIAPAAGKAAGAVKTGNGVSRPLGVAPAPLFVVTKYNSIGRRTSTI